jgi:transposase
MRKYSIEDKVDIYNKRKNGESLKSLSLQCGMTVHNIQYLVWLVDRHGFDILMPKKNRNYQKSQDQSHYNQVSGRINFCL